MCSSTDWCRTEVRRFGHKHHAAADPKSPHTRICTDEWPCIATEPYIHPAAWAGEQKQWLGIRYGRGAGWTYLQQQLENRSSEMMNQQQYNWPSAANRFIFYPTAPSTGQRRGHSRPYIRRCIWPNMNKMRPKIPCCLVPALEPSVRFEWLLCIHPAKPAPKAKTQNLTRKPNIQQQQKITKLQKEREQPYLAHAKKCFNVVWFVCKHWDTGLESCIAVVQLQLRSSHVV